MKDVRIKSDQVGRQAYVVLFSSVIEFGASAILSSNHPQRHPSCSTSNNRVIRSLIDVEWMLTVVRTCHGAFKLCLVGTQLARRSTPSALQWSRPQRRPASSANYVNNSYPAPSISPLTVAHYWDTAVPSPTQLLAAERFFNRPTPTLLYSCTEFRNVKLSSLPEVAFLGRSNVGKSSLLNTLMGRKICHTSSKPGRTRSMNFFAVGGEDGMGNPGKVVLLDMPGYGKGSREEWGKEILKYLAGRKQ